MRTNRSGGIGVRLLGKAGKGSEKRTKGVRRRVRRHPATSFRYLHWSGQRSRESKEEERRGAGGCRPTNFRIRHRKEKDLHADIQGSPEIATWERFLIKSNKSSEEKQACKMKGS